MYHIGEVKPDSSDMISNSLWCVNLGGYLWGDLGGDLGGYNTPLKWFVEELFYIYPNTLRVSLLVIP